MRLFIAVDPGERFRAELEPWLDARRNELPLRWVRSGHHHVTLRFLGERPESLLPALSAALAVVAAATTAFDAHAGAPATFPEQGRPRVSFLQVHSDGALASLASRVGEELARCDPDSATDPARFRAHLTLGRVRRGTAEDLGPRLRSLPHPRLPAFRVGEIALIQSVLGPRGPDYTTLGLFPLADPQSRL